MDYIESETVELKAEIVSDICKEIVAFANTQGGTLYIGVRDDGSILGVENMDAAMLRLNNMIRDSIKPDVTMFVRYEPRAEAGKQILVVTVQKGTDRPYYLSSKGLKPSGVYVRNGTSTDPSTDTAIRRMIKETDGDSYEEMRSLEQKLSFEAAQAQFAKQTLDFDIVKQKTLGLLSTDDVYSNLGFLLSDQCTTTIKAATFAGKDQSSFQDRREFTGSLFRQMEELYAYLDFRNQTRATFSGLYRTDIRDYPEDALREALMNALVHRDYSYSASTLVSVYEDRMEFVSIGGLPSGIVLEDIMLGLSVCRNPKLAAVFYRLKLIEAYGTGIPKIRKAYAGFGAEPKVEVTNHAFKIILPNRNMLHKPGAPHGEDEKIMEFLHTHEYIVRGDVDVLLKVSQTTANRILKRMVADGKLYQDGRGRNTKYRKK